MKKWILAALLPALSLCASLVHAASIVGTWKTIDDKTGYVLAHVKIEQQADKTYTGTIIDHFPFPGQEIIRYCQRCPAPYTDQLIKGLPIITKLKDDPNKANVYTHGKVLDPLTGKVYSLKVFINPDGRKLRIRGYIGTSLVGRSQTWLRLD